MYLQFAGLPQNIKTDSNADVINIPLFVDAGFENGNSSTKFSEIVSGKKYSQNLRYDPHVDSLKLMLTSNLMDLLQWGVGKVIPLNFTIDNSRLGNSSVI